MQGNCDTPIHLKTTNSPDESKINLFRKRLEGIKGTYVKIVKKTVPSMMTVSWKIILKQSQIFHRKKETIKRQSLVVIKV